MTEEEKELYQQLADKIAQGGNAYRNFDSTMNFDSVLNMEGESVLNMDYGAQVAAQQFDQRGLSTYNFRIFYTDVSGTGTPVTVTLFRSYFNPGTFVGDDLVFTNSLGDTATVNGVTSPFRTFQQRAETQPLRIAFTREKPVSDAQFDNAITFLHSSVYGGNRDNNVVPETFITPEQFQLLRVDIPMNFDVDGERGWQLNINATETLVAGGTRFTLFVNKIVDPTRELKGKSPVANLGGPGIMEQHPAKSLQAQIETLQQLKLGK